MVVMSGSMNDAVTVTGPTVVEDVRLMATRPLAEGMMAFFVPPVSVPPVVSMVMGVLLLTDDLSQYCATAVREIDDESSAGIDSDEALR